MTAGSVSFLIFEICFLPVYCRRNGACLQPAPVRPWAAVREGTQHLLGKLSNVRDWPSCVGMVIKGGCLSEISLLYAFCVLTSSPLWKYSIEDIPPLPVSECLWMNALPSLFSKFWVCDMCTFSKQINSAFLESTMVHFLNSCGR